MSAIDINKLFKDMVSAATDAAKSNEPAVKNYLQQVLNNHKDILLELAKNRAANKITEADFQSELADEKEALAAEMEGAEIIASKVAQDVTNAVVNVIVAAVKAAITAAL